MVKLKHKKLNLSTQAKFLKKLFPDSVAVMKNHRLRWESWLQPTPLSIKYRVQLHYQIGKRPFVSILYPTYLKRYPEQDLPHVYNEQDDLCLYFPNGIVWTESKYLGKTIVPWLSEWLYHYEIWSVTGEWQGGGTIH